MACATSEERPAAEAELPCNTKGERMLLSTNQPRIASALPDFLREEHVLRFDAGSYDLRSAAVAMLEAAGPRLGFGGFDREAGEVCLEHFRAKEECFSSFKVEKQWRQCVAQDPAFLAEYERLAREVVCPYLKTRIGGEAPMTFYYQYPPTLRLQPGPSEQFRRVHRDAEYGHQEGEINFWMPLTDYSRTGTTLWLESSPGAGDFRPMEVEYGAVVVFHGTLCRHSVPPNASACTRVSVDFRVGVGPHFDAAWSLDGIGHAHGRRQCVV